MLFLVTPFLAPVAAYSEQAQARGVIWAESTYKSGVDHARHGRFREAADEFALLKGLLKDVPIAETIETVEAAKGNRVDREAVSRLFAGIYACATGDFLTAMDELARATELDSTIALVYYYRAGIYIAAGEHTNAVSELDMAIKLNPEFTLAYATRGGALYRKMEFLGALSDFNAAVELDPTLATAYYGRGSIYSRARRFSLAISDFTRAIELRPDFMEAYNNRGILHMKVTKDVTRGCSDFKRVCELGDCSQYDSLVGDGHCRGVGDRVVERKPVR